ncbi:hypothetical protein PMIN04_012257 [Paraphaeosphaeria minitans]|uniref:non-specific serine/threonine protein kinase n=1 Tax=Paraphaeosphaeria minitans TaxID=565426 RepID=A0A9P6KKW2_9PLEO|nr:hypothetical protein PMIN01_12143 [Paraphaeosphaeria minitans]
MPRSSPHPSALFSLRPYNDEKQRGKGVVEDARNSHLVSAHPGGGFALDVGFNIRSKSSTTTLATLGRGDTDIHISGGSIARIQCSFEVDLQTGIVMLYDRSHSQTTQVFGEFATPFELGRSRKVVVQKNLNTIIGMGGVGRNLVMFELIWHQNPLETMRQVNDRYQKIGDYEENPCLACTIVDDTETVPPTRAVTRIHTPAGRAQPLRIRYAKIPPQLGAGTYGVVHRAVDVDSGKLIAVKILKRPGSPNLQQWRVQLKREVDFLSQLDHPHIVPLIALQKWDEPEVEIIMELQHGSLESLVTGKSFDKQELQQIAVLVFHHSLQALDRINLLGLIHRDMKPANILFKELHGQYVFLLADFGLSNHTSVAHTFMGSPVYMAPEMFEKGCQQTHKVDVWALFVTMMWTLDIGGFRQLVEKAKSLGDLEEIRKEVLSGARKPNLSSIQEMAIEDPAKRASAAQMLVKCFNGEGLSTPRNKIAALIETPSTVPNVRRDTQPDGRKVAARVSLRTGTSSLLPQTRSRARNAGIKKLQNKAPGPMARYLIPMPGNFPEEDAKP